MSEILAGAAGLLCLLALFVVARRERATIDRERLGLLDDCRLLFEDVETIPGADGFPGLAGRMGTQPVRVELIPDTMTVRRLPQLWLSVTLPAATLSDGSVAVLARPNGAEFYSLTGSFRHRYEAPGTFPAEVIVKGDEGGGAALSRVVDPVAAILRDPRVKEVAITPRAVRIIAQACEGRRGDHLLLRQTRFAEDSVSPALLVSLVDQGRAILHASQNRRATALGR